MADDIIQPPQPDNSGLDSLEQGFQQEQAQDFPTLTASNAQMPQQASDSGSAPVNVLNPEGQLVSIPGSQLQEALNAGYSQANQDHIDNYVRNQKYGSPLEQLKTGLEGAAESATFGASTGLERGLGVNPEDIRGRREENPGAHALGQVAGLVGSSLVLPGAGAAGALAKAGEAGAEALGLGAAESLAGKIGSAATKGFIENAAFQSGDEISKLLSGDPNQHIQTAAADIGLSGLLGGAISGGIGTVSPLWKATIGRKTDGVLNAVVNKLGGIEGAPGSDVVEKALTTAGIDAAPQVKAALMSDPYVRQASQILNDSATSSGIKHQEALKAFKGQLGDATLNALGKSPQDIAALSLMSENEIGEQIKKTLTDQLKEQVEPITNSYDRISSKFKETPLPEDVKSELSDAIAKSLNPGVSSQSAEAGLVQRVLKEVPSLKNLEQLRNYTSGLGNETKGIAKQELWQIGGKLRRALNDAEDKALTRTVADEAPDLISEHAATKSAYKDLRNTIQDLNDRLKVGPHAGPKTFLSALNDMDPETLLKRLSPKGKAGIIGELSTKFPEVAEQIRNYHLNQVVKNAASKAGEGEALNTGALLKSVQGLSPEMRQFILPEGAMQKLEAIEQLRDSLPSKIGKSGTPQGLDGLLSELPGSAAGMATLLLGHNPATAYLVGKITKYMGRDIPDYARLGLLKFLGTSAPVDSEGFKAMVDTYQKVVKGDHLVNRVSKDLFKAGREVLPESMLPSQSDRDKLDKRLKTTQSNPTALLDVGGKMGHYLPDHNTALAQTAQSASNYLNSIRPQINKANPLDTPSVTNPVAQAKYNRALDIAQSPLTVLHSIKQGTVTTQDVQSLQAMYPALYSKLSNKIMENMIDHIDSGKSIPYNVRMGLSIFMQKPLDYTMTPQGILGAQPSIMAKNQQNGGQPQAPEQSDQRAKHSMTALNKVPGQYMTAAQIRQSKALKDQG